MSYQYALDAADLLAQAERELLKLLSSCREDSSCDALADLLETLEYSRHHLLDHLDRILTLERHVLSPSATLGSTRDSTRPRTLSEAVHTLSSLLAANQARRKNDSTSTPSPRVSYFQTRSKDDTALFRLVVLLQLCLVRIDDARRGLAKKRSRTAALSLSSFGWWSMAEIATFAGLLSRVLVVPSFSRSRRESGLSIPPRLALLVVGTGSLSLTSRWMRRGLSVWWVSRKIHHSTHALDFWNQQWLEQRQLSIREDADIQQLVQDRAGHPSPTLSEKHPNARRLSKFQSALHISEGELRYLMLKRFMDVFYASVDTAASITSSTKSQDWQLHLATAAAATYYSLTGASARADEVTSSSQSARQLLEKAWGMVSLPAIKNLSLRTFKLVKGAAVADRIKIGNVPCFVLSRESVPELAAGITRFHRQHVGGPKLIHRLSTIDERKEHFPEASPPLQPFGQGDFRQRDVILHLTGGGFFAHFIASDLPYLLDWSAATGAVIVCPEYSLLPEHPFPCALYDVESVYESLLDPSIANLLGFQVNRIILTGESAGGNLAAALCVKLQMEKLEDTTEHQEVDSEDESSHPTRLPDAVLLSCPVLDLTMQGRRHFDEPTESDPVLSTGLVSAISDSYVPSGRQKSNPLISPLHGSDQVLAHFPPTLIFASSNDPVLDDSVAFNQRLRSLGVESDLRAVGNLPHAYLGLGTAGFPEAQQAQQQITAWLTQKLGHPKNTHNN